MTRRLRFYKALGASAALLVAGLQTSCIPGVDGAPCDSTANCPTGQVCVDTGVGGLKICKANGTGTGGGGGTGGGSGGGTGGGSGGGTGGGSGGGTGGGSSSIRARLGVVNASGRLTGNGITLDAQVGGGRSQQPATSATTRLGPAVPVTP